MKVELPLMINSSGPSQSLANHPAPVKLYLFGTFRAEVSGQPYTQFYSDKVRALLAYLVLEGEQPVHREQLAAMFWAGYQPQSARANLRRALTELRKFFEPVKLLHATYQTVHLEQIGTAIVCDVLEFRTLLADCRASPLIPEVEHSLLNKAQRANFPYSSQFLPGFSRLDSAPFHIWHAEQVAKLAEEYAWLRKWLHER